MSPSTRKASRQLRALPAEVDRLDVHVGQAGAGIGVEIFAALHAIVRPGQHDEEAVIGAQELPRRDDVEGRAEHGRIEVTLEELVAIAWRST
jgi:hypothetical protein